ncbi:MAG: hypothetical protein R3F19_35270 [Verrucomicrobiales bacterium]
MKLFALLLALLPITAIADVESSLGKSPDGRFELILAASSEKDYGRVIVRDLKSGATTETDSGQGYGYFPSGDVEAVWKTSSDAFAVTMRGTKRTWNTDVYIREGDAWEKLEFPPYVANIHGRQGVFKGGRSFHEAFAGFQGDNRFTLFSHIEPDWQQQEQAVKEADWKPTTQTEWKIELEYYHRVRPNCSLVSIAPNIEKDSEQDGGGQPATRLESK